MFVFVLRHSQNCTYGNRIIVLFNNQVAVIFFNNFSQYGKPLAVVGFIFLYRGKIWVFLKNIAVSCVFAGDNAKAQVGADFKVYLLFFKVTSVKVLYCIVAKITYKRNGVGRA